MKSCLDNAFLFKCPFAISSVWKIYLTTPHPAKLESNNDTANVSNIGGGTATKLKKSNKVAKTINLKIRHIGHTFSQVHAFSFLVVTPH